MTLSLEEAMTLSQRPPEGEEQPAKSELSYDEAMGLGTPKPPEDDDSIVSKSFRSLTAGVSSLQATAARIPAIAYSAAALPQNIVARLTGWNIEAKAPDFLLDNPITRHFERGAEASSYIGKKYKGKDLSKLIEEGDYSAAGDFIAQSAIESAPTTIALIAASMAGVPTPSVLAGAGSLQAASTYKEARDKSLGEIEAATAALVNGSLEAVWENAGTFGLIKWGERVIKDVGKQGGTAVIKNTLKVVLGSTVGEMNEEFWTQITQDFTNRIYGVEDFEWKDMPKRALQAAAIAAVTGPAMTAPAGIMEGLRSSTPKEIDNQRSEVIQQTIKQYEQAQEKALEPEPIKPTEPAAAVPETIVPAEPTGSAAAVVPPVEPAATQPQDPEGADIVEPAQMEELTKNTISEFRIGEDDAEGLDISSLIVEGKPQREIYDRAKALSEQANAPYVEAKGIKERIINEIGKFNLKGNEDIAEEIKSLPRELRAKEGEGIAFDEWAQGVAEKFLGPNADKNDVMDFVRELGVKRQHINTFIGEAQQQVVGEMQGQMFSRVQPGIKKSIRERTGQIKPAEEATITESVALRARLRAEEVASKQGFRAGKEAGVESVKSAKQIIDRRRSLVRSMRDSYGLTDSELRQVAGKDVRLMSNYEFKLFIDGVEAKAAVVQKKREAKIAVLSTLHEMEFDKWENLRLAMKLPALNQMTTEQLNNFNQILEGYQKGDEFLSVRKLETVNNTELQGIRTVREAKEKLAAKMGAKVDDLNNIQVSALDKFRFDTALAKRNPFYQFLVDETNGSLLDAEQRFYQVETEIDELVKKARESRPRAAVDKLIPSDKVVFEYLEATAEDKPVLAENLTPAELDLAAYMQQRFLQYRDYLIQHGTMEKYQENYITHIRRGFLETWKEDGLLNAFKEVFKQYQEDEATFRILEDDTQNILPLEKFFQFAMHRSGDLKPSQNVSKAFKAYAKAMYKKQALDKIVPALDIYAHALAPKGLTPRGLEMDRRLVKFVHEWVNNKKGRRSSLGGILPQGGAVDLGLRAVDALVTFLDLALNIPVSATVAVGENVATMANLGPQQYTRGVARWSSEKGKRIIEENRSLIGKDPWLDLSNTADDIGDKFHKGLFLLFAKSSEMANKIHLLGAMTDQEWAAGQITSERRAEINREIGRFRSVPGARSVFGSTSAGKTLTKYKSWALPILHTVIDDIGKVAKMGAAGDPNVFKSREFQELARGTLMTSLLALAGKGLDDAIDDDSFLGKILEKTYRESMTLLGALDPTVLSSVRILSFMDDLAKSLKMIVLLEEYKHKAGYKGIDKLKKTLTPRAIKNLSPADDRKPVL